MLAHPPGGEIDERSLSTRPAYSGADRSSPFVARLGECGADLLEVVVVRHDVFVAHPCSLAVARLASPGVLFDWGATLLEGSVQWRRARRSEQSDGPQSRPKRRIISLSVATHAERGIGRVGPCPDLPRTPAGIGHCHAERSETVDRRRKNSRRRENDTAFGPESLSGTTKRLYSRGAGPCYSIVKEQLPNHT